MKKKHIYFDEEIKITKEDNERMIKLFESFKYRPEELEAKVLCCGTKFIKNHFLKFKNQK